MIFQRRQNGLLWSKVLNLKLLIFCKHSGSFKILISKVKVFLILNFHTWGLLNFLFLVGNISNIFIM